MATRLSEDFRRAISWTSPSVQILDCIREAPEQHPAFTYLTGFRLRVTKASKGPAIRGEPGHILDFLADQPVVATGDGTIVLETLALDIAGDLCTNLKDFLGVVSLPEPRVLTSVPFKSNTDSNQWEWVLSQWRSKGAIPDLDQIRAQPQVSEELSNALSIQNKPFFSYLARRLGLGPGARFLDVGCGDAWACRTFRSLGFDVSGIDLLPWSIAAAYRNVPEGSFSVCDVFDLHERKDLGPFDLILCRNLGIAQKIIDWDEPRWVQVGRALVDRLSPNGFLYWIQMTNSSDQITPDGFSNASLERLYRYFSKFATVLRANIYGYVSLLISHRNVAPSKKKGLDQFDRSHHAQLWNRWASSPEDSRAQRDAVKLIYSGLASMLIPSFSNAQVAVVGEDPLTRVCERVASELRIRCQVIRSAENLVAAVRQGLRAAVLFTPKDEPLLIEARRRLPFMPIPEVRWGRAAAVSVEPGPDEPLFLISGDQDEYFDGVKLPPLFTLL